MKRQSHREAASSFASRDALAGISHLAAGLLRRSSAVTYSHAVRSISIERWSNASF
jgi:hypothetical protein